MKTVKKWRKLKKGEIVKKGDRVSWTDGLLLGSVEVSGSIGEEIGTTGMFGAVVFRAVKKAKHKNTAAK